MHFFDVMRVDERKLCFISLFSLFLVFSFVAIKERLKILGYSKRISAIFLVIDILPQIQFTAGNFPASFQLITFTINDKLFKIILMLYRHYCSKYMFAVLEDYLENKL